jgi:hypothetical protein
MGAVHYADTPHEGEEQQLPPGEVFRPGWYFWTETWADRCGPYASEEEAERMLERYCREVLGSGG